MTLTNKKKRKMTPMHPIVFIIVGIFVSITSYFVTNDNYNYSVFMYGGIILCVYGIVKWFITGVREKSRQGKEKLAKPRCSLARDRPIYCYDCKVHMPLNYHFCPFCGKRVQ